MRVSPRRRGEGVGSEYLWLGLADEGVALECVLRGVGQLLRGGWLVGAEGLRDQRILRVARDALGGPFLELVEVGGDLADEVAELDAAGLHLADLL